MGPGLEPNWSRLRTGAPLCPRRPEMFVSAPPWSKGGPFRCTFQTFQERFPVHLHRHVRFELEDVLWDVPHHLLRPSVLHGIKRLVCPRGQRRPSSTTKPSTPLPTSPSDKLPRPFVLGCPLWGVSALDLFASEQLLLPATMLPFEGTTLL